MSNSQIAWVGASPKFGRMHWLVAVRGGVQWCRITFCLWLSCARPVLAQQPSCIERARACVSVVERTSELARLEAGRRGRRRRSSHQRRNKSALFNLFSYDFE